jgi:glycerophosphoryl diester phosphodiesterase
MKRSPIDHLAPDVAPQTAALILDQAAVETVTTEAERQQDHEYVVIVNDEKIGDKWVTAFVDHKIELPPRPEVEVEDLLAAREYDFVWSTVTEEQAKDLTEYSFPFGSENLMPLTPGISEATYEAKVAKKASFLRRAIAVGSMALVGLGVAQLDTAPATAESGHHKVVDLPNESLLGKMSAKRVYGYCKERVLVVAHNGTAAEGSKSRYDVDTVEWIEHEIKAGHVRIELDEQVSSDGEPFGLHDRLLNAETNGKGVAHQKQSGYLFKLKTVHGERMASADDLIHILQKYPNITFQHEFKDYDNQWTGDRLDKWFQKFTEAGVMDQVFVSSASTRVLRWFSEKHPEYVQKNGLQWIGFGNFLPNLKVAKKIGITQVNVTEEAGLKNNARYLKQAKKMGIKTSVRSNPNGAGDDGRTWLNAIENGVDQIVTQGATKYFVCNAVRKAAAHR